MGLLFITAVFAGLEGIAWRLFSDGRPMPYWLMVAFILAALAAAGWADKAVDRLQERRRLARRAALAARWDATNRRDTPRP